MADKFSKKIRSKIMSRIRGKDTSPEILLRKELSKMGYRYRLRKRFKELNFKPDIVFPSKRICIFVDGCFWHGCPTCFKMPKSHKRFWNKKIKRNKSRDREQNIYLKKEGWKVIRVWEHEIKKNPERVANKISSIIDKIKR